MPKTFHIISLGCAKNLVDSEQFLGICTGSDYEITTKLEEANIVLINTCGFIMDAQEESINTILDVLEVKANGTLEQVYVTGCLVKRFKNELKEQIPEVDKFIDLKDFDAFQKIMNSNESGKRKLLTPKHYAYVRVSDGCNNHCAYCVIPQIRGEHKSVPMENILQEIRDLVEMGVKEIILLAQDTAQYGVDLYGVQKLPMLLDEIQKIDALHWLRLFYLHPAHLSSEIISAISRNDKILHYFEVPLQHINDAVLKKMNRKISKAEIEQKLLEVRRSIPDATFRTTFIVGHPGETEKRFRELVDFIREQKFERLGVFTYSAEEGTPAWEMKTKVSKKKAQNRMDEIMSIQQDISSDFAASMIGKEIDVIIDAESDNAEFQWKARAKFDAPDIDGLVYITKGDFEIGQIVTVEIIESWIYDLVAEPKL